jgi:hypothetical protein
MLFLNMVCLTVALAFNLFFARLHEKKQLRLGTIHENGDEFAATFSEGFVVEVVEERDCVVERLEVLDNEVLGQRILGSLGRLLRDGAAVSTRLKEKPRWKRVFCPWLIGHRWSGGSIEQLEHTVRGRVGGWRVPETHHGRMARGVKRQEGWKGVARGRRWPQATCPVGGPPLKRL